MLSSRSDLIGIFVLHFFVKDHEDNIVAIKDLDIVWIRTLKAKVCENQVSKITRSILKHSCGVQFNLLLSR
jgi:hypothetical protein